jgi:hypothetical protein
MSTEWIYPKYINPQDAKAPQQHGLEIDSEAEQYLP